VTKSSSHINSIKGYAIALTIGILVGLRTSPGFIGVLYVLLAIVCIYFTFRNNVTTVLILLPYLIYTEMFMRKYVLSVPYLFLQYLFVALFGIMILKKGGKIKLHSRTFVFLIFCILIELVNSIKSSDPDIARALLINELSLVVVVMWSCSHIINPVLANKILNHIKYAGVYLCGIVIARYLKGDVYFTGSSASEGTNGLAPVQISAYMGFVCTLFFFSLMNRQESKNLFINIFFLAVSAVIMLLSFSRGGLYFLGIMMLLYFLFNSGRAKSYFLILLLIPVGIIVYDYVNTKTYGLIDRRYEKEGTSGRDILIKAGWELFKSQPLSGIGTGNFNYTVKDLDLYQAESGAHNEFIRILAEEGILGIVAYLLFYILLFYEILKRDKIRREYALYFLLFFCLINVHNGLKISLQPIILMLAVATPSIKRFQKTKNVSPGKNLAIGFKET
jgi:O-antigen ligase